MRNLNILLAALIFISAGVGALGAYSKIIDAEQGASFSLPTLRFGRATYAVKSAEKCIGIITTVVSTIDEKYEIEGQGSIRIQLGDIVYTPNVSIKISFNQLRQLGGSVITLHNNDYELILGSTNVNPITIKMKSTMGGKQVRREWNVPGPIELQLEEDGTFSLYYGHIAGYRKVYDRLMEQPVLNTIPLQVFLTEAPPDECYDAHAGALNLTPIFNSLKPFVAHWGGLLDQII